MTRSAWNQLTASLDACAATRNFAASLELVRVDASVLYLNSPERVTKSATDKLCRALSRHTGQSITLVLRHPKTGVTQRAYSDMRGDSNGPLAMEMPSPARPLLDRMSLRGVRGVSPDSL